MPGPKPGALPLGDGPSIPNFINFTTLNYKNPPARFSAIFAIIIQVVKKVIFETVTLEKIVGGGQSLGTLDDGRKCFVWGGLPGETVSVRITKKKSYFVEGVAEEIIKPVQERIAPRDTDNYLSTSPWQIMDFASEQQYKISLIREAFTLHDVKLPNNIEIFSDNVEFGYRNKVEFSWYSELQADGDSLDLAFYRRGSKGKITVDATSLARPEINQLAQAIRNLLRRKPISARNLKTLLIRCDQQGNCVWQLYLKDEINNLITPSESTQLPAQGGEIIYSDPKSPASRITKRLEKFGNTTLTDKILNIPFNYACESFFQINIPVYEQALRDIKTWTVGQPILDLYSGVGTIGLTVGDSDVTLIEINEYAVREMARNIELLNRTKTAQAVLAPSEQALSYLTGDKIVIIDPPRAGLHTDVIKQLLESTPPYIIYLSCNPVTQARDVALLTEKYEIVNHRGYNFFPRTPHIEHLVVLKKVEA